MTDELGGNMTRDFKAEMAEIWDVNSPEAAVWSENMRLKSENEHLRAILRDLYATVKGECPALLNEDSGGDGRLDLQISTALKVD
jgi:regulator of replication initiation timing